MENPDLVTTITPEQFALLTTLLCSLIGIVYLGVSIFVYWLYTTKTEMKPDNACDLFTMIWFALVWPVSMFFLPFAMFDYRKQQEKKNEALKNL